MGASPAAASRPMTTGPSALGLVILGGFFGAAGRDLVEQAVSSPTNSFPWGTLAVNLGGAFVLGILLEAIGRASRHSGSHARLRLLLGTGFLGAFTTYSALAVEFDLIARAGRAGIALTYLAVSVPGGLACAAGGIKVASLGVRPPLPVLPVDPDVEGA